MDSPQTPAGGSWRSTEFWLNAASLVYSMWAGAYLLTHPWLEANVFLLAIGAATGGAGLYTAQRSAVKRAAALAHKREPDA